MVLKSFLTFIWVISWLSFSIAQSRTSALNQPIPINLAEKPVPESGNLCIPQYSSGCSMGDGFTDFAIAEIENYNSDCADNTGYDGWSEYLELGPANLLPGESYDCFMQTGYSNQYVTIWIDFNDDFELTADEQVLTDFIMEDVGTMYTAIVSIPSDAQPGLHIMRARTNWQNPASDPCESYGYGEAEDYMVQVGEAAFGSMGGAVTLLTGGNPVEDATITMTGEYTNYEIMTGSNGIYLIDEIMVGDYEVTCFKEGYNIQTTSVTIEEDVLLTQNFQLTHPEINVNPLTLEVELEQNQIANEILNIHNGGDGTLNWSASVVITDNSDDLYDLQFQYPAAGGGGEAGIESDGDFIYTTKWNGPQILKYDLEGNFIETFTIPGVLGLRDLAFDGTYFYGSAGIPVLNEMDFDNKTLVSSITSPVNIRAIAYNENQDAFYVNNWSDPVTIIDKSGNILGSFNTGPTGENYYGFAYDQSTAGGPFLWGYAQTGDSQNELIQMQLPSGTETGFTINIADKLTGTLYNPAGGLFMEPNLEYGKWTLGGLVQNQFMWGLDLGDSQTWLNIAPNSGTLAAGSNTDIQVEFNSTGLEGGVYEAQIQFTTLPDVGSPVVDVTLVVIDFTFAHPDSLSININCTDATLTWGLTPAGGPDPDSYNIYRNDELIANVTEQEYTDPLLYPGTIYAYKITAMYDGFESMPSPVVEIELQVPENLAPTNLHIEFIGGDPYLVFDPPTGCLAPDGFNLYRDGDLVGMVSSPVPIEWGLYEFIVTAIYYFGESGPSNAVVITGSEEHEGQGISVYPNPATDKILIQSELDIYQIKLYDHLGKWVSSGNPSGDLHEMNVSGYEPGLYFLRIETSENSWLQKLIIR